MLNKSEKYYEIYKLKYIIFVVEYLILQIGIKIPNSLLLNYITCRLMYIHGILV